MKILISGAGGLIGSELIPLLEREGHTLLRLVRGTSRAGPTSIPWQPEGDDPIDDDRLDGLDGVIHLAGENINGRWTEKKKAAIRDSRVDGTRLLVHSLARRAGPPSRLLCASAVGFYGDAGDRVLTESSSAGAGFLADVCRDWEAEAAQAADAGCRVLHLRFGVVLDPHGGALHAMLTPFRLGLGGVIGSGRQYMSWIALTDVARAIAFLLELQDFAGPVNVTAPTPVTNRDFTHALGEALSRPTLLPLPGFVARVALGEMADDTLLASARARPAALLEHGFRFNHPELQPALKAFLT